MAITKHFSFNFQAKKSTKGGLIIEGLANAAVVDRMKERIDPKGWDLENYKKNPTVLFDHGKDPCFGSMPIGKALDVQVTEGGLYTKIQLSSSKTEKITAIRDLIEEDILKTFSVGFNPVESEADKDNQDVKIITKAELIECSIVPVPMNQDSMFQVTSKSFTTKNPLAKRWFDTYVGKLNLAKKGAWVAAALHQRMYDMMETGELVDRDVVIKAIAVEASSTPSDIKAVLAGEVTPVPAKIVEAFAKMLRLDRNFLVNLDNGDLALLDKMRQETAYQEGGKGMPAKKTKAVPPTPPPAANEKPKDEEKPSGSPEDGKDVVYQIVIPKTVAQNLDAAVAMAKEAGYAVDKVEETGDGFVLTQAPAEDFDLNKQHKVDIGNGVMAVMAPKVSAKPADEAAKAEVMPPADEKPKEGEQPSADGQVDVAAVYQTFLAEVAAVEGGGEGNPMSWIADEAKWEKAKEMATAAGADDVYAFAVWSYLNVLDGGKKAMEKLWSYVNANESEKAMTGGNDNKNIDGTDDNPYHELSRQTNVLLGTLIHEVQNMSAKMDGLADLSLKLATAESKDSIVTKPDLENTNGKSIDILDRFRRDVREVETRLKRLNV